MKIFIWALPALIISALIFILSNVSYSIIPMLNLSFTDKIAHFFAFFVYTISVILAFDSFEFLKRKLNKYTFLWCSFYGILDEVHQYFIPGRDCNLYDWLADLVGVLIALLLIKYILKIKNKLTLRFAKVN